MTEEELARRIAEHCEQYGCTVDWIVLEITHVLGCPNNTSRQRFLDGIRKAE